jgi:hypothetical protein
VVGKTNMVEAGALTNYTDISPPIVVTVTPTNYVDAGGATNTPARYYRVRVWTP